MKNKTTGRSPAPIMFRHALHDTPTVRYHTGTVVFDEMFRNGRLCTRYWSPAGQVWPEMHIENLTWGADEPADTFSVGVEGHGLLAGGYRWLDGQLAAKGTSGYRTGGGRVPVEGVITLGHATAPVEIKVHTRVDGDGFLIRWLDITNTSRQAIGLTEVAPFAGLLWAHRRGCDEHLPPGGGSPFSVFYNHTTAGAVKAISIRTDWRTVVSTSTAANSAVAATAGPPSGRATRPTARRSSSSRPGAATTASSSTPA